MKFVTDALLYCFLFVLCLNGVAFSCAHTFLLLIHFLLLNFAVFGNLFGPLNVNAGKTGGFSRLGGIRTT